MTDVKKNIQKSEKENPIKVVHGHFIPLDPEEILIPEPVEENMEIEDDLFETPAYEEPPGGEGP